MNNINYYTTGITANGYITLLDNNLSGLNKIYYVTGEADFTAFEKKLKEKWTEKETEYIHNPLSNGALEGILNLTDKVAVIFNIYPHMPDFLINGENIEIINLNSAIDKSKYIKIRNLLIQLQQSRFHAIEAAYLYMGKALKVHDEWEKVYIDNMDFKKADELAGKLIDTLMSDKTAEKQAKVNHRFFGAATPEGAKDFIDNITKTIPKRYFIKGRPGTGKSTILKKIAAKSAERGFDTEVYHCGFDHNSLDMVAIRELNLCIFDSTAPHEYYPSRENDEIVDVYKEAVREGTDEKYKEELDNITYRYKSNIRIATSFLLTAKVIYSEMLWYYNDIADKEVLNEIIDKALKEITKK